MTQVVQVVSASRQVRQGEVQALQVKSLNEGIVVLLGQVLAQLF